MRRSLVNCVLSGQLLGRLGRHLATAIVPLLALAHAAPAQTTVHVPFDHPTIQGAIDAVQAGDTVLVMPGTYFENIDFKGKALTLRSVAGAASTTIDGGHAGPVVRFETAEPASAVLEGFTITNGSTPKGAGIRIVGASPTIRNNWIVNNSTIPGQSGWGAGVSIEVSQSLIEGNIIAYNTTPQGDGGGLGAVFTSTHVTLSHNVIHHNMCTGNGGGVFLFQSSANLVNNTIADNISTLNTGGGIIAAGANVAATNCIVWGNSAPVGPQVELMGGTVASFGYCDVSGGIAGPGNIAANPSFADSVAGNYELVSGSPCTDAGDPEGELDPDGTVADIGAIQCCFFDPWEDLRHALAGSTGMPSLHGSGTLAAGTFLQLELSNAKAFSASMLVVGVVELNAPFKGGTLVPYPAFLFPQTVDFFGQASFGGLWPPGIPSGVTVYFQYWIVDGAGPFGFAASNAVSGTTP